MCLRVHIFALVRDLVGLQLPTALVSLFIPRFPHLCQKAVKHHASRILQVAQCSIQHLGAAVPGLH
jgi:hypothetical protein